MPAVYVASPLGFTVPTRAYYAEVLLPQIAATGLEVLDPWGASAEAFERAFALTGQEHDSALAQANREAGATNERLIRQCELVFAVLDGEDVDSGTASEVGFAAALGRTVIGWRSDLRQAGDNRQSLVNLQVEHFVRSSGGSLHVDLDGAIAALVAGPVNDLELAVRLAREAGQLASGFFRTGLEVRYKSSPSDVVSDADEQAEALIRRILAQERPDDGMLGEEGTSTAGARRWLVDAVDGTFNFLKGDPFWCTAVALEDATGIVASAVHHVATGETFSAARGQGSWLNQTRLQRAQVALDHAVLATYLHPGDAQNATYRRVLDHVATSRIRGSGSLELAWVAAGRIDVWLQRNVLPWDLAPGSLLVTEAGGVCESVANEEGLWSFASDAGVGPTLTDLIADR